MLLVSHLSLCCGKGFVSKTKKRVSGEMTKHGTCPTAVHHIDTSHFNVFLESDQLSVIFTIFGPHSPISKLHSLVSSKDISKENWWKRS